MSELLKKPYKISLWNDDGIYIIRDNNGVREVTDFTQAVGSYTVLNQVYREVPLVTIGSNTMDSPIRAFDPKLTRELNGSNTLTFKMFYRYWDEDSDDYSLNPFTNLMVNERKVKLEYDGELYDFLVKQIQEDSVSYTFTYTCTDLYINELSKAGYEIEFDMDLENNQGTIIELADTILAQSDWQVDVANSDLIKQKSVEALYVCTLRNAITATAMDNFTYGRETIAKGTTQTIAAGQTIWVCYSSIANQDTKIQFFWRQNESPDYTYVTDEDGVILNSPNWEATAPSGIFNENMQISNVYFGNMLVTKQRAKYLVEIDKYCTEYTKNGLNYWSFTDTEYSSIAEIQNLLSNSQSFTSTNGWTGVNGSGVALSQVIQNSKAVPTLRFTFNPSGSVCNSGVYDNRALFSNGFTSGERFIFAIKCPSGSSYITGASIAGAPSNAPVGTGETTFFNFSRMTSGVPALLSDYIVFSANCAQSISYTDLLTYNMNFYVHGSTSAIVEMIDTKLFKYAIGINGQMVVPDLESSVNSIVKVRYNMFRTSKLTSLVNSIDNISLDAIVYEDDLPSSGFSPVLDTTYEKIRSIDGSKSNRFNLLQELCETFECWAKFTIQHDQYGAAAYHYEPTMDAVPQDGKIYYRYIGTNPNAKYPDVNYEEAEVTSFGSGTYYERNYHKYVTFKEFIGQDNLVGFRYGINLKSIMRNINSTQIVTKMIVEPNANKYAANGSCTVQYAELNPTGETALFNFEYYIRAGLLNRADLNRDLYGDGSGGLAYFRKLKALNRSIEPTIQELAAISGTLNTLISRQQVYTTMVTEAHNNKEQCISDIQNALNISYSAASTVSTSSSYNDAINSFINKRDQADFVITQYSSAMENTDSLVDEYDGRYRDLSANLAEVARQKTVLNKEFYKKYSRYIQEGSWISEDYIDADLYYLDGTSILYTSSNPQISYTINVVEISQIEDFEPYTFKIGDKTYMEDTEFFGYNVNGTPYQEEIVISQVVYSLDDPSQNTITVQNYKTQFEDLFQRITATTQSLQYAEGTFARAASAVNPDGTLNSSMLQNSLENNALILKNAKNNSVTWGEEGITITNTVNPNEIVRLVAGGILLTVDGGKSWTTGITGTGINANVITTGRLDTHQIRIFNATHQTFGWDDKGITAYMFDASGLPNYNKYVRFDQFGLYGYTGETDFSPTTVGQVVSGADFSLTWQGLSIRLKRQDAQVINVNDGQFIVYGDGSIYANDGEFRGTVYANDGEFRGTIKAADLQLRNGGSGSYVSILDGTGRIDSDYLDLGNIVLDGNTGNITLTGSITFSGTAARNSILTAADDGAYARADVAYTSANDAYGRADVAYDYADDAYDRAQSAYDRARNAYNITQTIIDGSQVISPYISAGTMVGGTIEGAIIYFGSWGTLQKSYGSTGTTTTDLIEMYSSRGIRIEAGYGGLGLGASGSIWIHDEVSMMGDSGWVRDCAYKIETLWNAR